MCIIKKSAAKNAPYRTSTGTASAVRNALGKDAGTRYRYPGNILKVVKQKMVRHF